MIKSSATSYSSLRRYIIILLCVSAAIPLIFIGGGIYYEYRKSMTDKITNQLTTTVLHHVESIEKFLHETSSAMKVVVELESFERISQQHVLQSIFDTLQREYDHAFEDMGVIDNKGDHVAYVGPYDLQNRNYSASIWFNEAMEKRIYISDVFLGFRQVPHFIIAVRHGEGTDVRILRATINAAKFDDLVENVRLGPKCKSFIINRDGLYQTRARSGNHEVETMDPEFLDNSHFDGVRMWEFNRKGVDLIQAKTWMKDNTWMLIVQLEADEAFAELYATRNIAIVVFVLGAVLVGIATYFSTELLIKKVIKANQERDLLNEQLIQSQKLASIGEFSAGIAHEINNPLAVIYVETELVQALLKEADDTSVAEIVDIKDSLNEIKTQVNRCKEITHKLLNFARKMDSERKEVDIHTLIDDVVSMRERDASFMNIAISREYQKDIPLIYSDPSLLRQVMLNLINNAIDALIKGGEIAIGTRMEQATAALQKNVGRSDLVVIFVRDTGMGIPEENLKKIFDPFFTTKAPGKGTGLGLSICHGIIQKLGGNISVASQVGKETTFTIKLPMEDRKGVI